MVSSHIESQVLALSTAEKAQVIQLLLQSISGQWVGIETTPEVCGGDACNCKYAHSRVGHCPSP